MSGNVHDIGLYKERISMPTLVKSRRDANRIQARGISSPTKKTCPPKIFFKKNQKQKRKLMPTFTFPCAMGFEQEFLIWFYINVYIMFKKLSSCLRAELPQTKVRGAFNPARGARTLSSGWVECSPDCGLGLTLPNLQGDYSYYNPFFL